MSQSLQPFIRTLTSTRHLLVFVALLLIFITAAQPITDPDFWWHLKTGETIYSTRSIPRTDIFSNLRFGSEWVTHEWLSELFMYSVFRVLGFGGLIVTFSAIIAATFWVMYRLIIRRAGHPYIAAFVLLLGAAATMPTWGVRPQMFSLLFASIFISVLDRYRRNETTTVRIWWLVPLMILWVNLHAGFALGPVLIVLTIAGLIVDKLLTSSSPVTDVTVRFRPLVALLAMCIAVVIINPSGIRIYSYPFETLASQAMMHIIHEWESPNFQEAYFQPLALLIFATFSALALSNKRVRPGELLLLVVTGWGALRSGRNVAFFALVAIPLFAEHLHHWIIGSRWGQRFISGDKVEVPSRSSTVIINLSLIVLVLAVTTLGVRQAVAHQPSTEEERFPRAAVNFVMTQRPPQPIFNEYAWGGYLIWKLYPAYRVYIDGRADVYGDELLKEYVDVQQGKPMWKEALDKRQIQTVLVKPDGALASLLRLDSGWQNAYEDKQAVVFVRR